VIHLGKETQIRTGKELKIAKHLFQQDKELQATGPAITMISKQITGLKRQVLMHVKITANQTSIAFGLTGPQQMVSVNQEMPDAANLLKPNQALAPIDHPVIKMPNAFKEFMLKATPKLSFQKVLLVMPMIFNHQCENTDLLINQNII
jgi:hypothetical protein